MPEQLTKHPEVTLQVLRSSGAKCGEGAAQDILTQCPAQSFCKLPGGELCVYGLAQAPLMTQLSASDWRAIQQAVEPGASPGLFPVALEGLLIAGFGVLVGAVLGYVVTRVWHRRA
jgi:hypothetical protein